MNKQDIMEMMKLLGVELLERKDGDEYTTRGYLVLYNPQSDKYLKVEFFDDSYGDGTMYSYNEVKPTTKTVTEYN